MNNNHLPYDLIIGMMSLNVKHSAAAKLLLGTLLVFYNNLLRAMLDLQILWIFYPTTFDNVL